MFVHRIMSFMNEVITPTNIRPKHLNLFCAACYGFLMNIIRVSLQFTKNNNNKKLMENME